MAEAIDQLTVFGISFGILILMCGLIAGAHFGLRRLFARMPGRQHYRQLILAGLSLVLLVVAVLAMPVAAETRGQMFLALALFLGAAIALSAGKPLGNVLAGMSFRAANPCSAGDYIKVGDYAGRIVRIDLLGIDIQTSGQERIHLPSLYLLANPASIAAAESDRVALEIVFGLNTPRQQVEELLLWAAGEAGLADPVVEIDEFSGSTVTYIVAGRAANIAEYTSLELALRTRALDAIQSAGANMAPSAFASPAVAVPAQPAVEMSAEYIAQTKAAAAERDRQSGQLNDLKKDYTEMSQRVIEVERELRDAGPGEEYKPLRLEKKKLAAKLLRLEKEIAKAEAALQAA